MESLTRPFFHHRRKLSNVNSSNGLSFSGKDAYDDVLLGAPKSKLGGGGASSFVSRAVAVEDYGEIFGAGAGGGVGTVKRGSSIPVLDLSDLEKGNGSYDSRRSNGKLDYAKIFGSFAADDEVPMAVPPYDELFGGGKKAKCDNKSKARTPVEMRSPLKGSERFNSSENNKGSSSEVSDQFLDGGKQLNMSYHKSGQRNKDGLNGRTHITQLHAVPGFTYFVNEDARQQKTENKTFPQVKTDANHSRSLSGDLSEGKSNRRGKWQLPDTKGSEGVVNGKNEVPGFTYFIDEEACSQKTKHKPFPQGKNDANHSRSSSGDILEGKSNRRGKWQLPDRQASEVLPNSKGDISQNEFDLKPHPSKVQMPSVFSANVNDNQGHTKRVKSSSSGGKAEALEKDSNGYLSPSSDDELDLNSAAAASAAALRKAIQQAQESIRIAKELMERKKDQVQSSKSGVNGSFKVQDRNELRYDQDLSGVRKNSTTELRKTMDNEVQTSGGLDQKNATGSDEVASGFTCRENHSIDRKADVEKHKTSAQVTEEEGVGTWFTQLLNSGKSRMAALASQLVDNRNVILQPTSKKMHDAEEMLLGKDTLERGTTDQGHNDAKHDALGKEPDLQMNVCTSVSDKFVQGGTGSVTLMSSVEKEASQIGYGFYQQEMGEEKLQDYEERTCDRHLKPEIMENGWPANELRNMVEQKKEEDRSFELEMGKKLDDDLIWQENESRLDAKENWRMQEASFVKRSNEYEKKETATEGGEEKQENSQDKEISMNQLEGYQQQNIDEQRSRYSFDGVENQNIPEEENLCEDIEQTPIRTYQDEGTNSIDAGSEKSRESERIEANLGVQESDNTEGETDKSKEDPRARLFAEAASEENLSACNNDESTISVETPGASEANVTSQQTRQFEVTDSEEDDNNTSGLESREENGQFKFEEDKEEAKQVVEEASLLKENEMYITSCLGYSVAQKHVMESTIQDASEALASEDITRIVDFDTTVYEEQPSMDTSSIQATGVTTKARDIESENAAGTPPAGEKTSNWEFSGMNGQKEIEESDEEYDFSVNPENRDGLVHESGSDAENIKDDGITCDTEVEKRNFELDNEEKGWLEKQLEAECSQLSSENKESEEHLETVTEMKAGQSMENCGENICKTSKEENENRERMQKEMREKDFVKKTEVDQSEKEREKNRIAVERAIREARERAFAEARERAERAAVERANAEVRQRAMAGAREKLEKVSAGTKVPTDKVTTEAKLRAERAAVERATAEARERALEKALSQKSTSETRTQVEKVVAGKSSAASSDSGLKHSFSSSDLEGTQNESAQRRKARLERHQRIMERAAKALAEKNMRDILAQREQAERNRLAETLDADIKRWASGKEGNLRALLSTLQYILGPDSGWQPISLTEIITTNAVKRAYRKATLYVHPDKLQQRGASIQQKYICEKVFDLLKAAWNRFNSEER